MPLFLLSEIVMEPRKINRELFPHISFGGIHIFFLLTIIMMIDSSPSCTASNLGNETDKLALIEFKSLIVEDPFEILRSWNESQHHCQWPGVTCERKDQRVTALNLYGQNLLGSISPQIGNLSFLDYINLGTNRLYGEIPQEVGRLYRLRDLFMQNNTLGGEIPFNLSYCTDLNRLNLARNKLMGEIPVGLGSLKKVEMLLLHQNNLNGEIPRSFGNLSSLEILSIPSNNLQGSIPNELGGLRNLTFFSVGMNNLSGSIPVSLYNISSLTIFSVPINQFTGSLPSDFGYSLPNLLELSLDQNLFNGEIPASLANASRLQQVDISRNSFTGQIPSTIGLLSDLQKFNVELNKLGGNPHQDFNFLLPLSNCSNLQVLSIAYNNISGHLPGSIANFSVKNLIMGGNEIYGPIPEALGSLTNLYTLTMENNYFSRIIPSSLGQLKTLQLLGIDSNQISGQIPSSLGNISQLGRLTLPYNRLEGKIPESLGNCKKLQYLDLSSNNLIGAIPSQIVGTSLLNLNLSMNSLSGSLPSQLGNLISTYTLDVSGNYLSGEIPTSIGDCLSLEFLNLRKNYFQGIIPSNLASIKSIQYLDLSRNNFSGEIPAELGSLRYLLYLNLSFNDLEGEVPTRGVFGNASAISVLGNNKLCGGIPELREPLCPAQTNKKHKKAYTFKLITAIICVGFFLIALSTLGALYWRRKKSKDYVPTSLREDMIMKLSSKELYKATNGFSLENLIGSGSFGYVYKGELNHDQKSSTLIAIKVLNLQNSRASKSFLAECKILRNIRHRNLLKILTYCSSIDSKNNEFKALVYEFMRNGNLDVWLHPDEANSSRSLSLMQRVNVAIDVACALQYLHSHCEVPIVHCDLKPSNILLDDDMCARVGDFGLARFHPKITGEISEMSSIGLRGSIGYAAPEYGTGSEVSTCGDIYSFGIILLEMMTGKRPADDIFTDGSTLHSYVEKALPGHVKQITDPLMNREEQAAIVEEEEFGKIKDEIEEEPGRNIESSSHDASLKTCIVSILTIALACSQESPTQRMDLNDVIKELHLVKCILLGRGRKNL